MDQTIAALLALLFILVTWAYAWRIIAVRRTKKGEHVFLAYLVAAIYSAGAACGALGISFALLLPDGSDNLAFGIVGTVTLILYGGILTDPKEEAFAPGAPLKQRLTSAAEKWKERTQSHKDQQASEDIRPWHERRLGIPVRDCVDIRRQRHLMFWLVVAAAGLIVLILTDMAGITWNSTPQEIIGSLIGALIFAALYIPIIPLVEICLIPFAYLSAFVEAGLRIVLGIPYTPTHIEIYELLAARSKVGRNN